MDGWSKFLNGCSSAVIIAIAYFIRPSTSYLVEARAQGSIKSAQSFLRTSQSASCGACFRH